MRRKNKLDIKRLCQSCAQWTVTWARAAAAAVRASVVDADDSDRQAYQRAAVDSVLSADVDDANS